MYEIQTLLLSWGSTEALNKQTNERYFRPTSHEQLVTPAVCVPFYVFSICHLSSYCGRLQFCGPKTSQSQKQAVWKQSFTFKKLVYNFLSGTTGLSSFSLVHSMTLNSTDANANKGQTA